MSRLLENTERRKRRDLEIVVWDRAVRAGHWLLALAFATLYLKYKKFPLHPYAGYLVFIIVLCRIIYGFTGQGAARFSSFRFSPSEMLRYLKNAFGGHAEYHFSHNPMGAAMVYALLGMLLLNSFLGLLTYSAQQMLGPFGTLIPDSWENWLEPLHAFLGHTTACLVACHLLGVLWASRLHRENYALAMLSGIRRIPRAADIPAGALRLIRREAEDTPWKRLRHWLNYRHPVLGCMILMTLIIAFACELVGLLVPLNRLLNAY
jgi:cytochrome b